MSAFQYVSGEETEFEADLVILATGYERPDLTFLEEANLFPEGYEVCSILNQYTYSLVNHKTAAKLVFAKFFDRGLVNLVD
jgi:thioredoxin reductase